MTIHPAFGFPVPIDRHGLAIGPSHRLIAEDDGRMVLACGCAPPGGPYRVALKPQTALCDGCERREGRGPTLIEQRYAALLGGRQ